MTDTRVLDLTPVIRVHVGIVNKVRMARKMDNKERYATYMKWHKLLFHFIKHAREIGPCTADPEARKMLRNALEMVQQDIKDEQSA